VTWTLTEIEAALRSSWDAQTCDPVDLPWSGDNPSKGQCGVTALVLNDLLGGDLMSAEVLFPDGTQQGWHTWNVFGRDGAADSPGIAVEVDLTREQFVEGEQIQPAKRITRPPGRPRRNPERYDILRERVLTRLGAPVAEVTHQGP
jgi:hypothetical protein